MRNLVYDTRFFSEHFYSDNVAIQERTKHELLASKACNSLANLTLDTSSIMGYLKTARSSQDPSLVFVPLPAPLRLEGMRW